MLDLIKFINKNNRQRLKGLTNEYKAAHTMRIEKRGSVYCLVNNIGRVVILIKTLDDLLTYLKNSDNYILNLSSLDNVKSLNVDIYLLTEFDWLDITNKLNKIKCDSFSIIKVSNLKEYISRLLLTKKVIFLLETVPYKLILINEKDLVLVSDLTLKVEDSTGLMFFGTIRYIKIENLDISNVTDLSLLFDKMYKTEIIEFKNFDTRKVQNFEGMFRDCWSLRKVNIEEIRTDSAKTFESMFKYCKSIERLNLNHFKLNNVINYKCMFYDCVSLKELLLDKWDLEGSYKSFCGLTEHYSYTIESMFENCFLLKLLDLTVFKEVLKNNNVNKFNIFRNCSELKL